MRLGVLSPFGGGNQKGQRAGQAGDQKIKKGRWNSLERSEFGASVVPAVYPCALVTVDAIHLEVLCTSTGLLLLGLFVSFRWQQHCRWSHYFDDSSRLWKDR